MKKIDNTNVLQSKQFETTIEALTPKIIDDFNSKCSNHLDSKFETMKCSPAKTVEDIKQNLSDYCGQIEEKVNSISGETLIDSATPSNNTNISCEDTSSAVSSVFSNEKDKDRRNLNIILHNILESTAESGETRKQHDTDTAAAIINQHLNIPTSISNVIRLGEKSEVGKPRLLRITVDSVQAKVKIVLNCIKIRSFKDPSHLKKVFLTPDLTLKEHKENKSLRTTLTELNKDGNKYQIKNGELC